MKKLPVDAFGKPVGMPVLVPIPIPTKGLIWYHALFNLLFYRRDFWLGEDFPYRLPTGEDIVIPKGFVFNGASIPRTFWAVLNPIGLLLIPGLIHDYGYRYRYLLGPDGEKVIEIDNRRGWDSMFLEICHITNGMIILDLMVAGLLKVFGWIGWNKNRKGDTEREMSNRHAD